MATRKQDPRHFVSRLFATIAKKHKVPLHIEPTWGHVGVLRLPDGRSRFFRTTNFDLNTLGAMEIARDKDYAAYFLRRFGYPVVEGEAFYSDAWCRAIKSKKHPRAALAYATRIGWPVIVKPNSASQGIGVSKASNVKEFREAVREVTKLDRVFLVQRWVCGRDYRIVVLDGKIISAYERLPLSVVGDGRATITALLAQKQRLFVKDGRDTRIRIRDPRISLALQHAGLTRRSVLPRGTRVQLLPNANLSTGGDAVDLTGRVHSAWMKLSADLARDMNLRYIGIDVMLEEGSLEEAPSRYIVLEINAAPGLDNYAAMGRKQMRIVEGLYADVLNAMGK